MSFLSPACRAGLALGTASFLAGIALGQGRAAPSDPPHERNASTFYLTALDPSTSERWPQPASFSIRRSSKTAEETVTISLGGTAVRGVDYTASLVGKAVFPAGVGELTVVITPLADSLVEPPETVVLTLAGQPGSAVITIEDSSKAPTENEAARFLLQAGFGADPDLVDEVRSLGLEKWIDVQMSRSKGYLEPVVKNLRSRGYDFYAQMTKAALWDRALRRADNRRPPEQRPDILRLKVAYCLSEIFVISQNIDTLAGNSEGVANYFDRLMDGSFGNYYGLLKNVALHPCMGVYLSHLGNRKASVEENRYPDENFAREVMQLFSIGLWKLNQDGSRRLDAYGQPIPTYDASTIREYARVFTGFTYGGPRNDSFFWPWWDFDYPMRGWDSEHDLNPKHLIDGTTTPQRSMGAVDKGAAAYADLDLAIGSLFNHPNVGPFIGRQLIMRMVTSNPSPGYISRVAARFNNNGKGVRGDMGAVVKAILLDPEARSYSGSVTASGGRKREPYVAALNLCRSFEARPLSGIYQSATYLYDFMLQEFFQSPSVFNFFSPFYRPSGEMAENGLYGPEFQIMTASTAPGIQNLFYNFCERDLSRWGSSEADAIRPNLNPFYDYAGSDRLVHMLADRMLDRRISPQASRIIRDAVRQIPTSDPDWKAARIRMAIYLIASSPDFHIQQ